MLTWIKRFFTDETTFLGFVSTGTAKVRALLAALGVALASGTITLDMLGERFGAIGWYAGWALIFLPQLLSSGDRTPESLKVLAQADPKQLQLLLAQTAGKPPTP